MPAFSSGSLSAGGEFGGLVKVGWSCYPVVFFAELSESYWDESIMEYPKSMTISSHTITVVPRYCETDQAGVIHHTVYPVWFEMGRTELLRANGLAYRDLEKDGVLFVVAEMTVKYRRPCFYDELLELTTSCTRITAARVEHSYQIKRPTTGLLLAEGSTILACVDPQGKPRRMPDFMYPEESV